MKFLLALSLWHPQVDAHPLSIPQPNLNSDSGLGKCSPIAISIERIKYMQRRNK